MTKSITLAFLLSVPLLGGCATILRGTHESLRFETIPPDANINIDGKDHACPVELSLRRKDPFHVLITKPGYRTEEFDVKPQWDGISLVGNVILPGGSVGLVADHVDGADMMFYKLAIIKLVPSTEPSEPSLVLNDFKGYLLTDDELARAIDADRRDRSQFFRGQP
jgi:hypothetical protein